MMINFKKLCILISVIVNVSVASADEGMWTLSNLPKQVYGVMQQEGYKLPYGQLYNDGNAIVKAVVNFGGFCSGVVVSPDGLVFTNHHCGFEAIRSHSTVEHDYMLNGFISKSYEEELPNKNLFVSFMVSQKDVTKEVEAFDIHSQSSDRQDEILDSLENAYQKDVVAKDSTLRCELKPFYEGNKYYLTTYRDFRDVRLVFAIPKSMGKFGGETDNWMWPRQTCDFSVFRVYCDPKTGGPAEYSKDNVPYHPATWAHVSKEGYKDGDFAMTMGYPGSTERYLSSYGIRLMRDAENAPRYQVRTVRQDVMLRHMRADEAVRIKYDSKYANSANYWKNALGMNKCIDSLNIIGLKEQHEATIRHYQDSTGYLKGKLNLKELASYYAKITEPQTAFMYFRESFRRTNEIVTRAMKFHSGMDLKGPEKKPKKQYVQFKDNSDTWDLATEKEILVALLENYRQQVPAKYIPDFYHKTIDGQFHGDYKAYVDALYNSMLMSDKPIYLHQKKVEKQLEKDLAVQMGEDLVAMMEDIMHSTDSVKNAIKEQERLLCDAKIRMEMDMPHYSDANFTLRMSYGQVGGYLKNGKITDYYTTPKSLYAKMLLGDEATAGKAYNFEYFAEPVMHELFNTSTSSAQADDANKFGAYTDPTTGTMNLCFTTSNDITGGNSGSPVFDGRNRLIGLAFDGNWESLSADIFFDQRLARCICVDIRYVLYMMDKWGHAERLINEINSVANAADTLQVKSVRLMGPMEIRKPVMIDSVSNNNAQWKEENFVKNPLSIEATKKAEIKSLNTQHSSAFCTSAKANTSGRLAQAWFTITAPTYAEGKLNIKGAKCSKAYMDNDEIADGTMKMYPGQHEVLITYVTDSIPLNLTVSVEKGKAELDTPFNTTEKLLTSPSSLLTSHCSLLTSLKDIITEKIVSSAQSSPSGRWAIVTCRWYDDKMSSQNETLLMDLKTGRKTYLDHQGATWMPKTDHYYYTQEVDGKRFIHVVDPATGADKRLSEVSIPDEWFMVGPTEDYLIITATEKGPKKKDGVYQILHPDDRWANWRDRSQLQYLDLKTGLLEPLTYGYHTTYPMDITSDGRYLLYCVSSDSITQRPSELQSYYRLDLKTMQNDLIIDRQGFLAQGCFLGSPDRLLFTATPESFGGVGNLVPKGMTPSMYDYHLYSYDVKTKKATPLTAADNTSVDGQPYVSTDGSKVYYLAERADSVLLYRLDVDKAKSYKISQPMEVLTSMSISNDGNTIMFTGSDLTKAYRAYALNLNSSFHISHSTLLYYPEKEKWENRKMGTGYEWAFDCSRGYKVTGYYLLPPDFDKSKKYPVIVDYYGGCSPTSRRFGGGTHYPQHYWNALGYIVFVVNPSGAAGFGQEWAARHVNTMGEGPAQDIIDATRWFAKTMPWVDADHIGCVSASYGGFMTQWMLTKDNPFACGISHAGISSHTSYWGEGDWGHSYSEVSAANSYPWTRKDLFVDRSPIYNADKIHKPLLFTHGTIDNNVPIGESIQMYNALRILGVPTAFIQVEGERHGIMDPTKRMVWINSMMAWFQHWLKDDPSWWNAMWPEKKL